MLAQPMSKTSIAALFSEGKTRTAVASSVLLDPYGAGIRTRAEEASLRELLVPLSELLVPLFSC